MSAGNCRNRQLSARSARLAAVCKTTDYCSKTPVVDGAYGLSAVVLINVTTGRLSNRPSLEFVDSGGDCRSAGCGLSSRLSASAIGCACHPLKAVWNLPQSSQVDECH